jgi:hypothetical protein
MLQEHNPELEQKLIDHLKGLFLSGFVKKAENERKEAEKEVMSLQEQFAVDTSTKVERLRKTLLSEARNDDEFAKSIMAELEDISKRAEKRAVSLKAQRIAA